MNSMTSTRAIQAGAVFLALVAGGSSRAADDLERALALLDRVDATIISVDFRDRPLARVVEELSASIGVPVQADWESLRAFSARPGDEVTVRLERAAASTVLSSLLLQLGDEYGRPVWEAHDGRIVLTTTEGTAGMRLTDAYDVRDLVADGETLPRLREQVPEWMREIGEGEGEDAEDESHDGEPPAPMSPGRELLEIIVDHVDPDAWLDFGGTRGRISEHRGLLLVTVAPTTHRRLRDALARLRRTDPVSVHLEAAIVDVPEPEIGRLQQRHDVGSRGLARAVLRSDAATVLWRAATTVAAGRPMEVESTSEATTVTLSLTPTPDADRGLLGLAVSAETTSGDDRRHVKTDIDVPSRGAAVIELPAATAGASRRLLVLIPQR